MNCKESIYARVLPIRYSFLVIPYLKSTLQLQHSIVYSSLCNEFSMIASLNYFSSLQNYDIISLAYCLESVCYYDHRTISEQFIECDGDRLF